MLKFVAALTVVPEETDSDKEREKEKEKEKNKDKEDKDTEEKEKEDKDKDQDRVEKGDNDAIREVETTYKGNDFFDDYVPREENDAQEASESAHTEEKPKSKIIVVVTDPSNTITEVVRNTPRTDYSESEDRNGAEHPTSQVHTDDAETDKIIQSIYEYDKEKRK